MIPIIPKPLPDLHRLLLRFHEDWDLNYQSTKELVAAFVANSSHQQIVKTVDQIQWLIVWLEDQRLSQVAVLEGGRFDQVSISEIFARQLECSYYPPGAGLAYQEWLTQLQAQLADSLSVTTQD